MTHIPLPFLPGVAWLAACWMLILIIPLTGCRSETPAITSRFNAFGTVVDLSLIQVDPHQAERAVGLIRQDFMLLENELSPRSDGPMARVNRLLPLGQSFIAPPSILPLLIQSQTLASLSGDLFNPAIGKLIALWGFNVQVPDGMKPPPDHAINQLVKANPRMSDIVVDGLELRGRNPSLRLEFSSIVRGYALDLAVARLRELEVRHALVQIGTDQRAIGDRSGQPWRIPIRRGSGSGVFATLTVEGDDSVVTRTEQDRDWIHGGVRYHQIIDPRSGRPAQGTQSVTVIHPNATTAAAAAVALFVAGPEGWHETAKALGIGLALLVDSQGKVHLNPELQRRLRIVDKNAPLVTSPPLTTSTDSNRLR